MKALFLTLGILITLAGAALAQGYYQNGYSGGGRSGDAYQRGGRSGGGVYDNYSRSGNADVYSGNANSYRNGARRADPYGYDSGGGAYALPPRQSYTPRQGSTFDPGNSPYNTGGGRLGGSGGDALRSNNQHFKW